jgi:hypothetical protein
MQRTQMQRINTTLKIKNRESNTEKNITIIVEAKEGINAQERIPCWVEKRSYSYYPCIGKQGI